MPEPRVRVFIDDEEQPVGDYVPLAAGPLLKFTCQHLEPTCNWAWLEEVGRGHQ